MTHGDSLSLPILSQWRYTFSDESLDFSRSAIMLTIALARDGYD